MFVCKRCGKVVGSSAAGISETLAAVFAIVPVVVSSAALRCACVLHERKRKTNYRTCVCECERRERI